VDWPVGAGGKGSDGVAGLVKQTPGGIGYVELAYAVQANLTYGPVKNKSGNFVDPSLESTTAAVEAAVEALKKDIRTSIVDTSAAQGYPIAGVVYAIVAKTPKEPAKTKAVVDFFKWVLGPGQGLAKELQYAPLAQPIIDLDNTMLGEVQAK
jgi:phosphate transport system substrate-binding protein